MRKLSRRKTRFKIQTSKIHKTQRFPRDHHTQPQGPKHHPLRPLPAKTDIDQKSPIPTNQPRELLLR